MATAAICNGRGLNPALVWDARLNLLGGFSMIVDGESWDVPDSCQRLLVFLALHQGPQRRPVVAGTLWPNTTDSRATANLRSLLWRLPEPSGLPLVSTAGASLRLSEHLHVDVHMLEATGWALIRDPNAVVDDVDPTVFLLELLPDWYEDWVLFERERLAQLRFHFLEALTYVLIERRRVAEALNVALRLVKADPLREGSQRALLAVHCAEHNIGQAQRQFESYRKLIRQTFGCEPSPSLGAMIAPQP
jgi:DNA-binding SARP family transcriptional activator